MVNFELGEYMRKMFIQSVTQATRKKIQVLPRVSCSSVVEHLDLSNQKVIGSTPTGRTWIFPESPVSLTE